MFNNKLTLVADYFIDTRTDLLIQQIPVSGISVVKLLSFKSYY
jgi:hypothetical protein